jgi:hypothetical protein
MDDGSHMIPEETGATWTLHSVVAHSLFGRLVRFHSPGLHPAWFTHPEDS